MFLDDWGIIIIIIILFKAVFELLDFIEVLKCSESGSGPVRHLSPLYWRSTPVKGILIIDIGAEPRTQGPDRYPGILDTPTPLASSLQLLSLHPSRIFHFSLAVDPIESTLSLYTICSLLFWPRPGFTLISAASLVSRILRTIELSIAFDFVPSLGLKKNPFNSPDRFIRSNYIPSTALEKINK